MSPTHKPNPMNFDSDDLRDMATRFTRYVRREDLRPFLVTCADHNTCEASGVDLTLEDVIEEELEQHARLLALAVEKGWDIPAFANRCDDLAVWEHQKLRAIIQVQPDGSAKVTRFDG